MKSLQPVFMVVLLSAIACSPDGGDRSGAPETDEIASQAPADETAVAEADAPVDLELAARGEATFRAKGCPACHTVGGGRLVGPDLRGVVDRRSGPWIQSMILSPDSMLRSDSIARDLFAEYMAPMADQGLSSDEARSILEYLRVTPVE